MRSPLQERPVTSPEPLLPTKATDAVVCRPFQVGKTDSNGKVIVLFSPVLTHLKLRRMQHKRVFFWFFFAKASQSTMVLRFISHIIGVVLCGRD